MQLPSELRRTADEQAGLLSIEQLTAAGVTSRVACRRVDTGAWRRVTRGVYDVAVGAHGESWDGRRRRAAWLGLLAYGCDAIAVGTAALALHGILGLPARVRPEVALPRASDRASRDGIRLRQFDAGMTTVVIGGRRVASPDWALAQAVPELPRPNALAVMDSAMHRGLLDATGIERAHDLARGRRGVAATHELWGLADGRAESPLESFGRLDCVDAGVPPDTLQLPLLDLAGRVTARADMGWRLGSRRWLVAEMDGQDVHAAPDAVYADRVRQNRLVASGAVDVLRFTGRDVPGRVGTAVAALLRQHGR
ncbi:type IV toxin-antitoxin system AbiEi family antitoxin domain-containing protein [Cellulosimicrobium cellulans]|uniref:type IV toxin-antitoxin system AbiEi family antitoxin domain-containing protein n=1 Tax=Cellulosimicrobium cellulans TaxID=1710 RepID=UPI001112ECC0|nr:type IV toxin-antitoxin system AbiEi family antitoxin domain-containing protein [Cellulosimicrobium cellulans]